MFEVWGVSDLGGFQESPDSVPILLHGGVFH